jgi:cytochrome bd-type quinol oxidase subunit 2
MEESAAKSKTEMFKQSFELLKHITTLSSGSILLVLAIAEKFLKEPSFTKPLFQAVICFLVSIFAALVAMAVLAIKAGSQGLSRNESKVVAWGFVMSAMGFFGGIAMIAISLFKAYG